MWPHSERSCQVLSQKTKNGVFACAVSLRFFSTPFSATAPKSGFCDRTQRFSPGGIGGRLAVPAMDIGFAVRHHQESPFAEEWRDMLGGTRCSPSRHVGSSPGNSQTAQPPVSDRCRQGSFRFGNHIWPSEPLEKESDKQHAWVTPHHVPRAVFFTDIGCSLTSGCRRAVVGRRRDPRRANTGAAGRSTAGDTVAG
jgi:hypothetical protein